MEQSIRVETSQEKTRNEDLTTPSRVQKRLFISTSNSSKRSLFNEKKETRNTTENISDAESDLGPMSPLALTDRSSCDSSPGRQFISPLATPERSPVIPLSSWDCLIPASSNSQSKERLSPFSFLKKVTRSARFSPRRILLFSPKSKSHQINQNSQAETTITPSDFVNSTIMHEGLIPETPGKESDFDDQLSYVAETPQKEENLEHNLITPLGSVYNNIPIPRVHRRKSLNSLESHKSYSPEIKKSSLKRHSDEFLTLPSAKIQNTEELLSVPKARAALFQETKNISKQDNEFTLNTKSFYGSIDKSDKSNTAGWRDSQMDLKRKRSLTYNSTQKKSTIKRRKGEINCGVRHGIKRPKPKRSLSKIDLLKTQKQTVNSNLSSNKNEIKENVNPQIRNENESSTKSIGDESNKKFFKSKIGNRSTSAMNNSMKFESSVNQGKVEHINKKPRLNELKFDTSDLLIDESSMQESLEQAKVDDILKILEDDWADDEYEATVVQLDTNRVSPKNSNVRLKDLTMSPGSELSNMASTMNIDDIPSPVKKSTSDLPDEPLVQKFYPLFSKGYSISVNEEYNNKKRKRSTKWQLSNKCGNSDNQYQIDAGQKAFGATQCNECSIVYQIGDPNDENAHLNYHNSFKTLRFQGWKNERVVFTDSYTSSRIILIEPKDSNLYWKKVTEVLEIVDQDLGLSDMKLSFYRDKKVYMYVRDKTILGVLVAECIQNAFKMIPELVELNCCTSETTPVKCGVNVVWTAMSHRRQGIATKLVDILRANYYYGYIMSTDEIAFSTPTPSGKSFAEKYTKTRNFKVY